MSKDYYEILGVDSKASGDDIKSSYRKLAMKYHPDRNPGDKQAEEKFKHIQEAYDTLTDDEKRNEYDHRNDPSPFAGFAGGTAFHEAIFDQFFNFKRSYPQSDDRGKHVETELILDWMDAVKGCIKQVVIDRRETCKSCNGTGAKDGVEMQECVLCDGKGKIYQRYGSGSGFIRMESVCASCRGTGKTISAFCDACHAKGFTQVNASVPIEVPAGIDNGMRITVPGEGDVGLKGNRGNLYCVVKLKPHFLFSRNGFDVLLTVPISYTQAIFGCKLEVPYPNGVCEFTVPQGTKHGTTFRLEGLGFPRLRAEKIFSPPACPENPRRGDLMVRIEIDIPTGVSGEYNVLLEKLKDQERLNETVGIKEFKRKAKVLNE